MRSPFLCKAKVTQYFGARPEVYSKFGLAGHEGIDLVPELQEWGVHALLGGTVVYDSDAREGAYGNSIRIQDETGRVFLYAHLSENIVDLGDDVEEGDLIGIMGNSGNSQGAHLHLSMYDVNERGERLNSDNGYKGMLNPEPFLGVNK